MEKWAKDLTVYRRNSHTHMHTHTQSSVTWKRAEPHERVKEDTSFHLWIRGKKTVFNLIRSIRGSISETGPSNVSGRNLNSQNISKNNEKSRPSIPCVKNILGIPLWEISSYGKTNQRFTHQSAFCNISIEKNWKPKFSAKMKPLAKF